MERCGNGDDAACDAAQTLRAEQKALMERVPVEPEDN